MSPLTVDQVGVVTALPQLHHGVDEIGHVVLIGPLGQEGEVLLQDGAEKDNYFVLSCHVML